MNTQIAPPQSLTSCGKRKHGRFIFLILLLLFFRPLTNYSQFQSISIDTTITADCEFDPFDSLGAIYGLKVSGSVTLSSDTSLIRIVLYDSLFNEYLIYESYPLIAESATFSFYDECDETCFLNGVNPYSIEVQLINATLDLTSVSIEPNFVASADSLQLSAKMGVELAKVSTINNYIDQNEMLWFADTNSLSKLFYKDKKRLFGYKYNLTGFEYYTGGLYFPMGASLGEEDNSDIVKEWDWRNRHGANDPTKGQYYYDEDSDGNGWMTSVKDQTVRDNCDGLCYIYSPIGAVEGLANIYLNNTTRMNYNLSEQMVLDCDNYEGSSDCPTECHCGDASKTNIELVKGIVDDNCYPDNDPGDCNPCNDPSYKIKINSWDYVGEHEENPGISEIKTNLIEKGPLNAWLDSYNSGANHFMVLVGYGTIEAGDEIENPRNPTQSFVIDQDSDHLGQTYWIFKNSYGASNDNDGYRYHLDTDESPAYLSFYNLPIDDLTTPEVEEPECFDKDYDGYWNWGIQAEHPTSCDGDNHIKDENGDYVKDSDDSNDRLGSFDENYYSIPVAPVMEVKHGNNAIPGNTFYTFYDEIGENDKITLTFTIENNGDAQLNLYESNAVQKNINISGTNADDFIVLEPYPFHQIPFGRYQEFTIQFTLTDPIAEPKQATVTIDVDEDDMDDYVFNLVFAKCPEQLAQTTEITGTEVYWDGVHTFFGDVVVKDGTTLYVTGQAAFVSGASLMVEQGAKVYVDGGLLTALCGGIWQGVDVWGDRNLSQYITENQGFIQLQNGGTISYAETGIETIKKVGGRVVYNSSGGIVVVHNGVIENCKTGVHLYPYSNFWPDPLSQVPSLCNFEEAIFINDQHQLPYRQLYLQEVYGIDIRGCTFEHTSPGALNITYGIYSESSDFTLSYKNLSPGSDPPTNILPSRFTNLRYGVYASNTPAWGRPYISNNIFTDNVIGVYVSLVNYPVIINNEFLVRSRFSAQSNDTETIGLYLNDPSVGFVVEENMFYSEIHRSNLPDTKCAGIHLTNTGGAPNEIYNNSFNSLKIGVTAAGSNQDGNGVGLCIKCNDFTLCFNDVYITNQGGAGNLGIATNQGVGSGGSGNPTLAGGNTFSVTDSEIENNFNYGNLEGCNPVVYTHHGNFNPSIFKIVPYPIYPPSPSQQITLNPDYDVSYNSKSVACPSNYGSGGIDLMATTTTFNSELTLVGSYNDTLDMFVDGGDTESLAWDVNMSTPPEATALRQDLLDESPYLSDTVMKAAIAKEEVLPGAMVRDVLIANPQSAKSTEVLQALDNRSDTIPDYMLDQIMLGQNLYGAKELLEQQLARHKTQKGKALRQLIHHYLTDTINRAASADSIINLLANDNELSSQYRLALKYLGLKDSTMAYSNLYDIPVTYDLDARQETEYDLYEDLLDVKWQIVTDTTLPDSTTIEALFDIEEYYNTTPGVHARNILIGLGELAYDEPVYFPDFNKAAPIWRRSKKKSSEPSSLKVFPNPAGHYFIAEFELHETVGSNMLVLTNLNGHNILVIDIRRKQDQIVIPTLGIKPGVYILQLINGSKVQESVKLTILSQR